MNRKHNTMRILVVLFLLGVITTLVCCGCASSVEATDPMEPVETTESNQEPMARFTIELQLKFYGDLYIITDNDTGIQYLAFETSRGVGMTQLLPGEG